MPDALEKETTPRVEVPVTERRPENEPEGAESWPVEETAVKRDEE